MLYLTCSKVINNFLLIGQVNMSRKVVPNAPFKIEVPMIMEENEVVQYSSGSKANYEFDTIWDDISNKEDDLVFDK